MCMEKINHFLNRTIRSFPNETHTTTRWAIFQSFISLSIFFFAIFISLFIYWQSIDVGLGMTATDYFIVIGLWIALLLGIALAVIAVYLAIGYLRTGSKDPTATKSDIRSLKSKITKLEKKIK